MKTLRLAACWLIVALPLAWGVSRSVIKSLPLFDSGNTPKPIATARP